MKLKLFRRFQVECTCEYGADDEHTHSEPTGKTKQVELEDGRKVPVPETREVKHNVGRPMITMRPLEQGDDTIEYGGHCHRCDELVTCVLTMSEAGLRRKPEGWSADTEAVAALPSGD